MRLQKLLNSEHQSKGEMQIQQHDEIVSEKQQNNSQTGSNSRPQTHHLLQRVATESHEWYVTNAADNTTKLNLNM